MAAETKTQKFSWERSTEREREMRVFIEMAGLTPDDWDRMRFRIVKGKRIAIEGMFQESVITGFDLRIRRFDAKRELILGTIVPAQG